MINERIVKKAIKGDAASFLALMKEVKTPLYKTAYAFFRNEHDALEAIQAVTVQAYESIHQVREPAYIKTWLTRVMINYCQKQLKHTKREQDDSLFESLQSKNEWETIAVHLAIEQLPDYEQSLIYLKYFHGFQYQELAAMLEKPEGTIKTHVRKALGLLRLQLEEGGESHVR